MTTGHVNPIEGVLGVSRYRFIVEWENEGFTRKKNKGRGVLASWYVAQRSRRLAPDSVAEVRKDPKRDIIVCDRMREATARVPFILEDVMHRMAVWSEFHTHGRYIP